MRDPAVIGTRLLAAVVCVIAVVVTFSPLQCDAADLFRARRGVAAHPNAADSRPKDKFRLSECRNDNHCKMLPNTVCIKDQADGHLRCLCDDGSHPLNDGCITLPQELGMPCELDSHCGESDNCAHKANETSDNLKICQPDNDPNDDNDDADNGGVRSMLSIYLGILVAVVLQNNHN